MKKIIEIKFDIHEEVQIEELNSKGTVVAVYISDTGIQYNVRYFYNGEAKTVYFFEKELTKRN